MRGYAASGGSDGGFSLVEVIVAFVIFAAVSGAAMAGITNAINASHTSQQRVDAANVAQAVIAQAIASANLNTITAEVARPILANVGDQKRANEEDFTVLRWVTFAAGATTCAPGVTFTVNVEVHQKQTNTFLARSDTSIACPPA